MNEDYEVPEDLWLELNLDELLPEGPKTGRVHISAPLSYDDLQQKPVRKLVRKFYKRNGDTACRSIMDNMIDGDTFNVHYTVWDHNDMLLEIDRNLRDLVRLKELGYGVEVSVEELGMLRALFVTIVDKLDKLS
jgi:hypothetical protein